MEYKWIAQDKDGRIVTFKNKPEPCLKSYWGTNEGHISTIINGNDNSNWKNSLINLETHNYKIEDGILMKIEKELKIQYKHKSLTEWKDLIMPECEYRIKPKAKIVRFRNYFNEDNNICACEEGSEPADEVIRQWIGEWQEVEVPIE